MSPRKGFDRVMVHHDLASNLKLIDFTDSEVKAFVLGVLPIASMADMRGAFTVGKSPATAAHVAEQARVTKRVGTSTIAKLREVGILESHDDGVEWVHDFHEYNPAPKVDDTSAERARKYRESQREKRDASRPVTRDASRRHAPVTPMKVEGEGEVENNLSMDSPAVPAVVVARPKLEAIEGNGEDSLSRVVDDVVGILQRGIDSLTGDEPCKVPTAAAVREALLENPVHPDKAIAVAMEVRAIAQSQDRAPNIAGLFRQRLSFVSIGRVA